MCARALLFSLIFKGPPALCPAGRFSLWNWSRAVAFGAGFAAARVIAAVVWGRRVPVPLGGQLAGDREHHGRVADVTAATRWAARSMGRPFTILGPA